MKPLFFILAIFALVSCKTTYVQMFELKQIKETPAQSDLLVMYDFWGNNLTPQITLYNNTDSIITVYWTKSSYIVNQNAVQYYRGLSFSAGESLSATSTYLWGNTNALGATTKSGLLVGSSRTSSVSGTSSVVSHNTVTYKQPEITTIPPKSQIQVSTPVLFAGLEIDLCDKTTFKPSVNYTPQNTVLKFRNFIVYTHGSSQRIKMQSDEFFISKTEPVTKEFYIEQKYCDPETRTIFSQKVLKPISPFHFYTIRQF